MSKPRLDRDLLLALAAEYAHGTSTRADTERLESLLRADPAARRVFVEYCMLHGQLALSAVAVGPGRRAFAAGRAAGVRRAVGGFAPPTTGRVASALVGLSLAAACLAVMVATPSATSGVGSYDDRQLPLVTVADVLEGGASPRTLTPSTLRPEKATALLTASGADVNLPEAAVFGVTAADAGTLYGGSVQARLTMPDANFSVTAANLRIVDKGTAFAVERIDADHVRVTVVDGEVEVQSRRRLPVCWWPFDEAVMTATSQVTDVVGGLSATLGSGATPVAGLVGAGAVRFDNTPAAAARIQGGTGDRVGTGRLSMAEGITIEAMIVSAWRGGFRDYDEIYRKEDGNCRVLLSFQNDGNATRHDEPDVPAGPCLSFGLHLAAHGYAELDMPLDGRDGRPTAAELADGRPHHLVATYDSFTGRKAIFVDGVKRFEHLYPVGTLILCGGPVPATIGNHGSGEPFTGVIDEFALYDFALTAAEVAEHHRRAAGGENYFGATAPGGGGPHWQAVTRLVEGQSMTFDPHTGLPR